MRKITGKALATVLAMALITSSFSGTFALAAKTTEKAGSVELTGDDETTLVKNTEFANKNVFNLKALIGDMKLTSVDKTDKGIPADSDSISFKHAKGETLLSIDKDGMARVKTDKTGTETIMVYGETTVTRDDKDVTLKGQKEITINVIKNGTLFVGVDGTENKKGEKIPSLNMAFNDVATKNVNIYKATAAADSTANFAKVGATDEIDGKTFRIEASNSTRFGVNYVKDEKGNSTAAVESIKNLGKGTSTLKLTIKSSKDGERFSTTEESTTATIQKRIDVRGPVSINKESSTTIISGAGVATDKTTDPKAEYNWADLSGTNISGYDINVLKSATGVEGKLVISAGDSVSIGKVTSDEPTAVVVTLNANDKTKVGDIKDIDSVTVDNATVGAVDIKGSFDMSEGRATSVEADGYISIIGGTVSGNVKSGDTTEGVTIDSNDDEINTVVSGTVEAKKLTVKVSSEDGKVQINNVLMQDDGVATLSDSNITINKFDAAYEGDINFEDFQGKIANVVNASDISVDEDSKVVIEGAIDLDTLDIDEDGSIEFKDAVKASSVSGEGKLIVGVEKLYVSDDISGDVKLRLSGSSVNVGDVAFKAAKDVAAIDSFSGVGFNLEKKSVDKNTDSFLVKSTYFAGVALDKSEATIAKNFSDTITVTNYPASTALPTGASIVWDFSDADKDVFEITAEGASVKIAVKDYDDVYSTSNTFDLTATVVDKDGDALEDYDAATCTVTAIKEVPVSSDLSGIVEVPQGSTKDFVVNSSVEAPVTVGTGDVAVHAVKTAFADAKATYSIKATGAVGTTAGVYATVPGQTATKLFVIKVTAPVVTSDTTVDFNLTAGSRYVFKITAPAAPAFTVGNGGVLKTEAGKIVGNDYYFSVYAIGAANTSTGVYVNGVKVCTVTVK